MKRTEYFETTEALNEYYPNGVPSTVLAIVQPNAESDAVLFTTSNNSPMTGEMEAQGGYNLDPEDKEHLTYSYAAAQDMYANYATTSYVVDYVTAYGGGSDIDPDDVYLEGWWPEYDSESGQIVNTLEQKGAIDLLVGTGLIDEESWPGFSYSYFTMSEAVRANDPEIFLRGRRWDEGDQAYYPSTLTPNDVFRNSGITEFHEEFDENAQQYNEWYTVNPMASVSYVMSYVSTCIGAINSIAEVIVNGGSNE